MNQRSQPAAQARAMCVATRLQGANLQLQSFTMPTTVKALAYHITWTTYGTWLSGDQRGWLKKGHAGIKRAKPKLEASVCNRMADSEVVLTVGQRALVEDTIRAHCQIRKWQLHAVNSRTNHIHVVVSADRNPEEVMSQLKAQCSRRLSDQAGLTMQVAIKVGRRRRFTEGGGNELIHDEEYLQNAIKYVLDGQ